ncbi:MAG: hypothetical protein GY715_09225 [Planctomycetes bacterium]|nr:hypothetical protein [Planctomycetota bacterium]
MLRSRVPATCVACCLLCAPAQSSDPWADAVVSYSAGVDGNPAYADATTTLGAPERFTGEGIFPGVVSPFNPAFGTDELVAIGLGGSLVVHFDEPVADDPGNPFGIDLLVFGNAGFIDSAYPAGIVGGLFGAEGGQIEVSADGIAWVSVAGSGADGMFPTVGYGDTGPYDTVPGGIETNFTRPVDPALALEDLSGLDHDAVRALYDGSGGGAGVDLAGTGLAAISFVRITNAPGAAGDLEIDAFADVTPVLAGDANGDGSVDFADILAVIGAWGACPPGPCAADLSGNGTVGFEDVLIVISGWTA